MSGQYFDPRCGFKAKVGKAHESSREGEIQQLEEARQSMENIMRIARNGSSNIVWKVIILIPTGLLKQKSKRS